MVKINITFHIPYPYPYFFHYLLVQVSLGQFLLYFYAIRSSDLTYPSFANNVMPSYI